MLTIWDKLSNTFRRLRWKLTLSYVAVTVGALLGVSNPDLIGDSMIGQPFDAGTIPGLKRPLQAALEREEDPEQLFATLDQDEKMVVAVPVLSEGENGGQAATRTAGRSRRSCWPSGRTSWGVGDQNQNP